jgi:hypothetical protein
MARVRLEPGADIGLAVLSNRRPACCDQAAARSGWRVVASVLWGAAQPRTPAGIRRSDAGMLASGSSSMASCVHTARHSVAARSLWMR